MIARATALCAVICLAGGLFFLSKGDRAEGEALIISMILLFVMSSIAQANDI